MSEPGDAVGGMTERLLDDAGIGPGMRVLDLGCGRGEVTRMIARRVGASGQVVGVDRDAGILEVARARTPEMPCIMYRDGDICALPHDIGMFHAVFGRRVLMYQADAVGAVRRLTEVIHPGGITVFHEHDTSMVPVSLTKMPLHERVHHWIWQTVEREGADLRMGLRLSSVLEAAGLVVEHVRAEAVVQTLRDRHHTAAIVRAILPRMVQRGVTTPEEVDVESLDARLLAELQAPGAVFIGDVVFGAWGRRGPLA